MPINLSYQLIGLQEQKSGYLATIRFSAENSYLNIVKIIKHSDHTPRVKTQLRLLRI